MKTVLNNREEGFNQDSLTGSELAGDNVSVTHLISVR
jgi:hypothetical protein